MSLQVIDPTANGSGDKPLNVIGRSLGDGTAILAVMQAAGMLDQSGNYAAPTVIFVNAAAGGDTDIIPLVSNKRIRVVGLFMVAGATATTVTFKSGTGPTTISCAIANGANGGLVLPVSGQYWFQTGVGEKLFVTVGAGSTVGIQILYITV